MKLDANVKRAIVLRLKLFLKDEEGQYARWLEVYKPRLKKTAASHIDRRFRQRIQAFKLVIWILSPRDDRDRHFPGYWSN